MVTIEEQRERKRKYYHDNKQIMSEQQKQYSKEHPEVTQKYRQSEKCKETKRKYYEKNRERLNARKREYGKEKSEYFRNLYRQKKYGLSPDDYDNIIKNQENKCCICNSDLNSVKKIVIDHCHKSGNVRGILCSRCNLLLGMAEDNPELLQSAINYLIEKEEI